MNWKILIAAVLIIGAAAGYYFYNQKIVAETTKTYETTKVMRMDLIKTVSATGTVQPRDSVEVSGKVTARIKEILVEENDHVTEGQVVAILDGKDFEAKLDQANFTLTNARQKLERTERLYNIGAKSLQELQDAQYEYDRAKDCRRRTENARHYGCSGQRKSYGHHAHCRFERETCQGKSRRNGHRQRQNRRARDVHS